MKKYKLHTRLIFFAFSMLLSILQPVVYSQPAAAAESKKVLRVAFPEVSGFSETAPDGTRSGLIYDYLIEIAKYTNWEYEFVDVPTDDVVDYFLAGDFDLMGGVYYSPEMEEQFGYSNYSCGYSKSFLLGRMDDSSLKSYDISSINGKKIGVFERNTKNIERLEQYLTMHDLSCELVYITYEQMTAKTNGFFTFLENGDVDLLLTSNVSEGEDFRIVTSFDSQKHYIVTQPGETELLEELNTALDNIMSSNPSFAEDAYNNNFSDIRTDYIPLSPEEMDYIRENNTITVAVPNDMHPLFCINNDDHHDGLLPDILNQISASTGLTFSYVYADTYQDSIRLVQNGKADILGFYLGSEEDAAQNDLALTRSYTTLRNIILRNKKSNYPSENLTAALLEGDVLTNKVTASKVLYFPSLAEAMKAVSTGEADYIYGLAAQVEEQMQKQHFNNLIPVAVTNDYCSICFGLAKPADTTLLTILDKSINQISDQDNKNIFEQNMVSIGSQTFSLAEVFYSNPIFFVTVLSLFFITIMIAMIIVAKTRVHSALMQADLERAEAENCAKSEFLSRMSHEIRTPMNAIMGMVDLTSMVENLPEEALLNLSKIQTSSRYLLELINDILDMSRIENGMMTINNSPFSLSELLKSLTEIMTAEAGRHDLTFISEQKLTHDIFIGDELRLRQVLMNLLSNAFKFTSGGGHVTLEVQEQTDGSQSSSVLFRVTDDGSGINELDQKRIFEAFEQVGSNFSKSQGTGLGLPISSNIISLMGSSLELKSIPGKGSTFYFTLSLPVGTPSAKAEAAVPAPQPASSLNGMKILLAEDNDLNAEITIRLLDKRGAVTTRAENGIQTVRLFAESEPGGYQAILMDIRMPQLDGLDATRQIRRLNRPDAASVPIIAMTASSFQEDVDAAMAAGMNCFLAKPLDVKQLYRTLEQLASN